ncbi:DegV family protein [Fodinicola acaciae]|uniref:DegV family protein n=1 Tax=Fodinicola acaciae TaxID=2681555 RepID=UPI0013D43069|nr:DegV family protein [Fodinicola acaciae]
MTRRVAVVTDSTAGLSASVAAEAGVRVVPLTVTVGGRSGVEGVDVTPADVAAALGERRISVATSRPSPAELARAYADALADASDVVAVHLSSKLSGTYASAVAASREFSGTVSVVDSGSTAMGLGFPVLAAAAVARDGGDAADVRAAAEEAVRRTTTLFYVDTLEYLRRGGRIGAAAALVGTALAVKPILRVDTAGVALAERVRTSARGLARLEELAVELAIGPVNVAVHHLAAPQRAETLATRLSDRLPQVKDLLTSEVGAVIGAHVGPGVVGVVVSPG